MSHNTTGDTLGLYPTSLRHDNRSVPSSSMISLVKNIKPVLSIEEENKTCSDINNESQAYFGNYKVNFDSPRTQKAMKNLGIDKSDCILRKFEDFGDPHLKNDLQKLRYIHHANEIFKTVKAVLKERHKVKKMEENLRNRLTMSATKDDFSQSTLSSYLSLTVEQRLSKIAERQEKYDKLMKNKALELVRQSQVKSTIEEEWEKEEKEIEKRKEMIEKKKKKDFAERKKNFETTLSKIKDKMMEDLELRKEKEQRIARELKEKAEKKAQLEAAKVNEMKQLDEQREKKTLEIIRQRQDKEQEAAEINQRLYAIQEKKAKAESLHEREQKKKLEVIAQKLEKLEEKRLANIKMQNEKFMEIINEQTGKMEKRERNMFLKAKSADQLQKFNTIKSKKEIERVTRNIDFLKDQEGQRMQSLEEKNEEKLNKLEKFLNEKRRKQQEKIIIKKDRMDKNLLKSTLINDEFEKHMHHILKKSIYQKQKIDEFKKEQENIVQKLLHDNLVQIYQNEKIIEQAAMLAKCDTRSPQVKKKLQTTFNLSFDLQDTEHEASSPVLKMKQTDTSGRSLQSKMVKE